MIKVCLVTYKVKQHSHFNWEELAKLVEVDDLLDINSEFNSWEEYPYIKLVDVKIIHQYRKKKNEES